MKNIKKFFVVLALNLVFVAGFHSNANAVMFEFDVNDSPAYNGWMGYTSSALFPHNGSVYKPFSFLDVTLKLDSNTATGLMSGTVKYNPNDELWNIHYLWSDLMPNGALTPEEQFQKLLDAVNNGVDPSFTLFFGTQQLDLTTPLLSPAYDAWVSSAGAMKGNLSAAGGAHAWFAQGGDFHAILANGHIVVPEPSTVLSLGFGLMALGLTRLRRKK